MTQAQTADVIIIGGGVAGLSTAMQLAGRGASVQILERERLGNGSTGRAAGLLGQLRGNAEHTRMLIDGVAIVRELEQLAGVEIFVQTGSLRIAETPERAAEIASLVEMGKSIGFDIDHMPIDEVARHMPYMRTDDLVDACYCPTDGHLQPAELVSAYIKVGKERGVRYKTNTPVTEILLESGRVRGVRTPTASIMRRSSSTPAGHGRISMPSWPTRCCRPRPSATTISRRGPIRAIRSIGSAPRFAIANCGFTRGRRAAA